MPPKISGTCAAAKAKAEIHKAQGDDRSISQFVSVLFHHGFPIGGGLHDGPSSPLK